MAYYLMYRALTDLQSGELLPHKSPFPVEGEVLGLLIVHYLPEVVYVLLVQFPEGYSGFFSSSYVLFYLNF